MRNGSGRLRRLVRSPRAFVGRASQVLRARVEHWTGDRGVRRAAGEDFLRDIDMGADAFLARFRSRVSEASFPAFRDRVRTRMALTTLDGDVVERSIRRARAAADGRFDLLGYRDLEFGSPVDWHLDPVSGRRAPLEHWSRVPYLDPEIAGDHKVIWELSRHRHLVDLARAYWLTEDETWTDVFLDRLVAWMEANPLKRGINWASSLEVGVRSIAWLWALHAFVGSDRLGGAELARIAGWLRASGRHLEHHISTWFSPNTHLTGEALALVYLGVLLPEIPESARWRARGLRWLTDGLDAQIRPDGVYFEQSTYYHRYTADFSLHLHLLSELHDLGVSARTAAWIEGLTGFLAAITRPDGTIPLIGDDDGGRLLFLDDRAPNDARSPILAAATLFERSDWAFIGGAPTEELVWLLGPDAPGRLAAIRPEAPSDLATSFEDSGFHVSRSGWGPDDDMAVIRCGPHGPLSAGHAHADALAIDLTLGGTPLLVDPGTGAYMDPRVRDGLRATAAHNTVTIGRASSSVPSGPFGWETHADATTVAWCVTEVADLFEGWHDGFARVGSGFRHERTVLHVHGAYWICRDRVVATPGGGPAADVVVHFTLAPGLTAEPVGSASIRVIGPEGGVADLTSDLEGAWSVGSGRVSPVYGNIEKATTLTLGTKAPRPGQALDVLTVIGLPGAVGLTRRSGPGEHAWHVGPGGDLLAIRVPDAQPRVDPLGVETDFEWLWARPAGEGEWSSVFAFRGSTIRGLGARDLVLPRRIRSIALRPGEGAVGPLLRVDGTSPDSEPDAGDDVPMVAREWAEGLQLSRGSAVAEAISIARGDGSP